MRQDVTHMKPRRVRALAAVLVAASLSLIAAALDEGPRIPGAVTTCPAWLKKAPFDVEAFLAMPTESKNAAPVYLDALAEFSPDVVVCLPASQKGRAEIARGRSTRLIALEQKLGEQPASLDRKAADALLEELRDGFRKLAMAQRRPMCVFALGLSQDSILPHVQAARDVARATDLRVFRNVEKGNLDLAVQDLASALRLSRDLRPRGPMICQLMATSMDGFLTDRVLPRILASPRLTTGRCDRLLAVLKESDVASLDRFTTGAKGDYLMQRAMLHLVEDRRAFKNRDGGPAVEAAVSETDVKKALGDLAELARQLNPEAPSRRQVEDLLVQHDASWSKERAAMDELYRLTTAPEASRYAERVRRIEAFLKAHPSSPDPDSFWTRPLILQDYKQLAQALARAEVFVRTAECLVAIRRWQLAHGGADPIDLTAACKEAKLPGIPIDPFSSAPLKLAVVAGRPVVYSVGPDGVDDRALKDSNLGRKPDGDMLFRLPAPTK